VIGLHHIGHEAKTQIGADRPKPEVVGIDDGLATQRRRRITRESAAA
jgi:hypothetical protein